MQERNGAGSSDSFAVRIRAQDSHQTFCVSSQNSIYQMPGTLLFISHGSVHKLLRAVLGVKFEQHLHFLVEETDTQRLHS